MRTRRRRKGFDEERKRQLKQDLRRHFLLSKKISTVSDHPGVNPTQPIGTPEPANPETQLEQAQKFGHQLGDFSIFPEQTNLETESESTQEQQSESSAPKEHDVAEEEKLQPSHPKDDPQNETFYSKLALEQLHEQEESRNQQLYHEQVQYLIDLPAALESANQGHIIKPFGDPFLVLEELLTMAEWDNPELNALQRLWLVWSKWESYYTAWQAIARGEERQLPGKGKDAWYPYHQERGVHQLETPQLESTILQVMRREIIKKSAEEREFLDIPTPHQIHCYFLGLRRQDWATTSWQRPTPNGANLQPEEDEEAAFNHRYLNED